MTPAEEYLEQQLNFHAVSELGEDLVHLMNNFAYQTLKNLYNSLGKEMDSTTILNTISNYKAKFHQCENN